MNEMETIKILRSHREEIINLARELRCGEWLGGISRFLDHPDETDTGGKSLARLCALLCGHGLSR